MSVATSLSSRRFTQAVEPPHMHPIGSWQEAATIDSTLKVQNQYRGALSQRFLRPETYSRKRLFDGLASRRPVIFDDFTVGLSKAGAGYAGDLIGLLHRALPQNQLVKARLGSREVPRSITIRDLLERWERKRSLVIVTDLHFRGTPLEKCIDVNALSDFNLLLLGSGKLALQEMMTLVVSSAGTFTDSHSDDPDGSNHCFVGQKLWLAWDTFEGQAAGLQDISRGDVSGKAAFDLRTFLSLRSSCWFVVSDGQTLFLPGSLTHKVVTLRPYLGVGSFFIAFAGGLETLMRWYEHGPLWARDSSTNECLLDEVTRVMRRKLRALSRANGRLESRWGCSYLASSVERFFRLRPAHRRKWESHTEFANLLEEARLSVGRFNGAVTS